MPTTITGSIGVFTMLFNTAPALKEKAGVTFDVEKNAPYADFPSVTRELTSDEKGRMQQSVDTVYQIFLRRVAAGRLMAIADVDSIAQGRVWTGTDALRIGLVDGLGGIDRALQSAASKAGLKEYRVRVYPEPDNGLQWLIRQLPGAVMTPESFNAFTGDASGAVWLAMQHYKLLRDNSGKAMMVMPMQATFE
jgi:protease-4